MVEKYGLRAERNAENPIHNVIPKEEIADDLARLFGEKNSKIVDALWWVINDAACTYNPLEWDED